MTPTVLTISAAVVGAVLWGRWERRHGIDDEHAARQGAYGWRLVKLTGLVLVLLVAGLTLASFGVPGGAIVALVALLALMVLVYLGPFLGPRRRRS